MTYLQPSDYLFLIEQRFLNQITTGTTLIDYAEAVALEEVKSYIVQLYDTDIMFRPFLQYNALTSYLKGDRVVANSINYLCIQDAGPGLIANPAYFVVGDDRIKYLNMLIVDIMLFHLMTSIDMGSVEDIRMSRYKASIAKLKEIAKGTTTLDGATLRKDNRGMSILWGSNFNDNYDLNGIYTSNRKDIYEPKEGVFYTSNNSNQLL